MADRIWFEVDGDEANIRGLDKVAANLSIPRLLTRVGWLMVGRIKERVLKGETLTGGRIKPAKRVLHEGGTTLIGRGGEGRTGGGMIGSITARVSGNEVEVGPQGFESKKAGWLHYGTGVHGPSGKPYTIVPKKPGGVLAWKVY